MPLYPHTQSVPYPKSSSWHLTHICLKRFVNKDPLCNKTLHNPTPKLKWYFDVMVERVLQYYDEKCECVLLWRGSRVLKVENWWTGPDLFTVFRWASVAVMHSLSDICSAVFCYLPKQFTLKLGDGSYNILPTDALNPWGVQTHNL